MANHYRLLRIMVRSTVAIAVVLLLLVMVLISAMALSVAPINISSKDGLKLTLSDNGTPLGIAINGTSIPMLVERGGYSIREVIASSPNLISNPNFERGTGVPLNWSFIPINGSKPVWDRVHYSGNKSIKISIPGTKDNRSGYPKSDLIEVEPLQNYTLSVWVKANGTGGTHSPAVRVAELDVNKKWLRCTNIVISKGTYNWTRKQITFMTSINTRWVYVYANIWDGYGTFWVDDMVLTGPLNTLANPSFERGITMPQNWSFITVNGNAPTWDTVSHIGLRSVKISVPGAEDNKSGYVKSRLIKVEPMQYYTLYSWVKTQDVEGTAPALKAVELDANKKQKRHTNIILSKGTTDWTLKQRTFQTSVNTRWVYVYANIWNGYGTFWVDDIRLEPVFGQTIYLNGTLTKNSNTGIVTQKVRAKDIDFTFTYTPKDRYIELHGEIHDLSNRGRAIQVMYNLPVDANDWNWGDYIRGSRVINRSTHYKNVYGIGNTRTQSMYPFAWIGNDTHGLSIAVPMDVPRIYRTGYNLDNGYSIQYDFGLSNKTLKIGQGGANFTFVIYKIDEPEWGFRSAAKKYYKIYPFFFEKRIMREGLWVHDVDFENIKNITDFGFAFEATVSTRFNNRHIKFNNINNIQTLIYNLPWIYWKDFGSTKPTYEEVLGALQDKLTVINSLQKKADGTYYLDDGRSKFIGGNWRQNIPLNLDPDIQYPNYFDVMYSDIVQKLNKEHNGGFIDNWTFGEYNYWDKIFYEGNHSAKVSSNTTVTTGSWESEYISIKPNTNYTFFAQIKRNNLYNGSVRLVELDINGTKIAVRKLYPRSYSKWVKVITNFTSSPKASKAYLDISIWKGNGTFWVDNVGLVEMGKKVNLIPDGGFEKNKRGNIVNYTVDGVLIDSISVLSLRSFIENYNRSHWSSIDYPLVFSYENRSPVQLALFSQYEYVKYISDKIHKKNKILGGNSLIYTYSFYAHLIDKLGSETPDVESDSKASYRRTLSYNKTNSNKLSLNWGRVNESVSRAKVKEYIKSNLFYGIFPSINLESDYTKYYFNNASLYNRDRDLFRKYIPIIKEISKAGWEPIPYAYINNSNIIFERFGSNRVIYYTIKNNELTSESGVLTVDLNKMKNSNDRVNVTELISGADHELDVIGGKIKIKISINSQDVLVYKIN